MTPEQEQQVARALAETARHETSTPMPDDVARRLDDVLAELRAPRVTPARGPHDEVAAARRRRRRPRLLAAAVAAAVVAIVGAVVVPRLGTTTGSDASAGSGVSQPEDAGRGELSGGGSSAADSLAVPELRSGTLARDVQRVVDAGPVARRQDLAAPAPGKKPSAARSCLTPPVRPGERLVPVRLDGRPASLVLGAVNHGVRSARVYSCVSPVAPVARTEVQSR